MADPPRCAQHTQQIHTPIVRGPSQQARAQALEADRPPVVADGLRALSVVEQRVFKQRRAEVEAQLATAHEQLATTESTRQQLQATQERLSQHVSTLGSNWLWCTNSARRKRRQEMTL